MLKNTFLRSGDPKKCSLMPYALLKTEMSYLKSNEAGIYFVLYFLSCDIWKKYNGLSNWSNWITINYKIVYVISNKKYMGDTKAYDSILPKRMYKPYCYNSMGFEPELNSFLTVQTKIHYDLTNFFVVFNVVNDIILF